MSITWINPVALVAFALIALPIAIHLLVRQQTRSLPYPSLRFLRETALAAFRRRAIQDAALLACRIAIVAAAVIALAGPVLHTAARTAGYANRLSRAIVAIHSNGAPERSEGGRLRQGFGAQVFRAATFNRTAIADAIGDALRWLDAQPPSAREIVFSGSFRRGSIDASDLALVPREVGIRFVADTASTAPNQFTASLLTRRDGTLVRVDQLVQLNTDATRMTDGAAVPVPEDRLRVIAAPADQLLAEAALRAAVDEGVPWTADDRRLLLVWDGADAAATAVQGVEVVRMAVPNPSSSSARATWDAIDRATPSAFVEPVLIPSKQLQSWSRPPGEPSPSAMPGDEGDRRWFWAAALALLGVEYVLRREKASVRSKAAVDAEARVA
jgi:hypothetical protein